MNIKYNESTLSGSNDVFLMNISKNAHDTLMQLGQSASKEDEEEASIERITLKPSPFCHETPDTQKELRGWVLDIPYHFKASRIPLTSKLFHGISIALCDVSEEQILSMIQNEQQTKENLASAIETIMGAHTPDKAATWGRCHPSPYTGHPFSLQEAVKETDGSLVFKQCESANSHCAPIIDSEEWLPELSPDGFIGFYHQWLCTSRGNRLVLYCVCQSFLPRACKEFFNMAHKVGNLCSAGSVCLSEEIQWLRTACSRNRARLIANVCDLMHINVPFINDYNASTSGHKLAVITNETLHHDMIMYQKHVRVLNYCAETRNAFNGVCCVMAPWEGLWIFQGLNILNDCAQKPLSGISDFGKPYGEHVLCTSAPQIADSQININSSLSFVRGDVRNCKGLSLWNNKLKRKTETENVNELEDVPSIAFEGLDPTVVSAYQAYILNKKRKPKQQQEEYETSHQYFLNFDENVLSRMSELGWPRNQGIIKLIPMVCGYYENWKASVVCESR